jgi:hypothetical protein
MFTASMKPGCHRWWVLCLSWLLTTGALRAQQPVKDLQFDMFPGYGGALAQGAWFPVIFELKNDGTAFNGMIQLSAQAFGGAEGQAAVELPSGTLKRVTLPVYIPQRYAFNWGADLYDEKGRRRAEALNQQGIPVQAVSWKTRFLGAIPRATGGTPVVAPIRLTSKEYQPVVARFQPTLFPDNPIVLQKLDALYLSSEKALELKDGQVRALLAWLHGGGQLIVGVESISDVNNLPWLKGIFPGELTGSRTLNQHPALFDWLRGPMRSPDDNLFGGVQGAERVPFANLAPDPLFETEPLPVATIAPDSARVEVATPEAPLIVSRAIDRGRVTALLFSPEREPVRTWKHLPVLWARLLEVPAALYENEKLQNTWDVATDGIFGAMVDSRQVRKLPVEWLLVLLVVYLVVIGPLDRWWLKKINRPVLTWITFPCYVVLFSGLIYVIGYKLRAGDSEWNELHLVDVFPAGAKAELRGRLYAGIYSPANQRYPLASSARMAVLRTESRNYTQDKGGLKVVQRGDSFRAELDVPVWMNQLCVSDYWQGEEVPLELRARREGGRTVFTINNRLDHPLTNVRIAYGGRLYNVENIPANSSQNYNAVASGGQSLSDWVVGQSSQFQNAAQQRQQVFGGQTSGRIDNAPEAASAASFIGLVQGRQGNALFLTPPGLDVSPVLARGQAVLLGWTAGYAPIAPMNQFKAARGSRNTLWRLSCEVL